MLGEIVDINGLDMLQQQDRERLRTFLETVKSRAPVMHMSFSTDPSPEFVAKLMAWLRQEIHPQLLLTVGLQPTIGAGCVVRTTNRYFDFTLRQSFAQKRDLLLSQLVRQPEEQSHGR